MKIGEKLIGPYVIFSETKYFPLFYFDDKEGEENKIYAWIVRGTSCSGKKTQNKNSTGITF